MQQQQQQQQEAAEASNLLAVSRQHALTAS
jgi:hypothetical protein